MIENNFYFHFYRNDELIFPVLPGSGEILRRNVMKIIMGLIFIMSFITSCSTLINSSRSIGDFNVSITPSENKKGDFVRIRGTNLSSALYIKDYDIIFKGDKVFVKIYETLKDTGYSDGYDIQFYIPERIIFIVLGDNEIIWKR
jgi:hypothetical protein